jgi:hypothetical protein
MKAVRYLVAVEINLFTVLKKLKECVGFFFFNNLIATNGWRLCVCLPLAQSFKLPQMLMGQIAQNRCYTLARLIKR